jgi:hypothetical protein
MRMTRPPRSPGQVGALASGAALAFVAALASGGALAFGAAPASGADARAAPAPARADVYAIVVGYNGAREGLPTLRFADDDAVRFALLLSGLAEARDAAHVRLLVRLDVDTARGLAGAGLHVAPVGPPTRAALRAAFDDVARALAARPSGAGPPVFYFVYAGHGLRGRILLEPEAGPDAALTGHELRAAVAELARAAPALQSFVFLDACRSQSLFTERGDASVEVGPDLSAEVAALEARAASVHIGVLTAAFSGHAAGEVGALGAGYFSHVLASGFAGAADADGDRLVSFAELAAFVAYNTERLGAQRPWFSPPGGDLAAPAVDLRGARTVLDLSASPAGRYVVEATGGRPILVEAVKGERPLRLALPAGKYRVLRAATREPVRAAEVELVADASLDLARSTFRDVFGGAPTLARGDDAATLDDATPAFASAFTPAAVATLTAAFDAGREPAHAPRPFASSLGVSATVASAPLALAGAEVGASARYRRLLGRVFVGARASFGRSAHAADTSYRLDRMLALLEVGPRWSWAERLELTLGGAAGGGPLLRRAAGGLAGELFAPTLALGAGAAVHLDDRWSATLDFGVLVQWVSVDGARRRDGSVAAQGGLSWRF